MKQSKKLTRAQRTFVKNNKLDTMEWRFISETPSTMKIINTKGEIKEINKK